METGELGTALGKEGEQDEDQEFLHVSHAARKATLLLTA